MPVPTVPFSWDRLMNAYEKVRDRMERATSALNEAGVPYAVAGGNAVAVHVARADESLVRNTRDVDVVIRREDLDKVRAALEARGFVYRHVAGLDIFLDGAGTRMRECVRVMFANEKVRETDATAVPDVTESEESETFPVLTLEALVRTELNAFRNENGMNLRDLIDARLIDATWPGRFTHELRNRLQSLLNDPNG